MQWTQEQQPIIHSRADKLLVQAFAGTGKTTTLVGYATHHASVKMLYLCYNKSVELAAKGRFPRSNVVCKTAHGLAYAVYGMDIPIKNTFNEYRKRFGIESRYKLMNACRARTTSKNPALRLLYLGLGFLLINIWIFIQWTYLSIRRQGGRKPIPWSFKTMLRQITRKIEDITGFNDAMPLSTY